MKNSLESVIFRAAPPMSLKLRLNLMITALLALVMLVGALLMIGNAREDVRAEVESSAGLALHLLDTEILHYTSDYAWLNGVDVKKASIFRLQSLGNIRHLRIEFYDFSGRKRDSNRPETGAREESGPPLWFVRAMGLASPSMHATRRQIFVSGRVIGELVVTPDPTYEIAEIWDDTKGLFVLVGIFFLVVNAMIYWAVGRALRPVDRVQEALSEIEQGKLEARLPQFELPELSGISRKFNAMAQTLQQSVESNHKLTQQIIRLQEDERKSLARDLHDEIGQCLTAINIDAMAIVNARKIADARESANAIAGVARQLMDMVHHMLQRLRPGVLDELGLAAALHDLVYSWRQRNRGVSSNVRIADDLGSMHETVAIAAYRIIQECMTNVSRHADARRLTLCVARDHDDLLLQVEDDGHGFDTAQSVDGYGLAGMRERVQGLGGSFDIESAPGAGTRLLIRIPCQMEELA